MSARTDIVDGSVPRLPRGVRLKFDEPRQQWVLLAPERMFVLDDIALAIVRRCDGAASVEQIVDGLANDYKAPRDVIATDVTKLLQDLVDKGILVT